MSKQTRKKGPARLRGSKDATYSITEYEGTDRVQVTCRCKAYSFPHRMGGGDCYYHPEHEHCVSCDNGYCEYHDYYNPARDPRNEALTAAERNPGLTRAHSRGRYYR